MSTLSLLLGRFSPLISTNNNNMIYSKPYNNNSVLSSIIINHQKSPIASPSSSTMKMNNNNNKVSIFHKEPLLLSISPYSSSSSLMVVTTRMSKNNHNHHQQHHQTTPPPAAIDRIISAISYTLPFINSLQYARFLFNRYPSISLILLHPFVPFINLYRSIPYASFIAFFALYLGVVRNPNNFFTNYVRFNAMQAVTLDVLLVLPLLLTRIFFTPSPPPSSGLPFKLLVWSHTAVFIFSSFCFLYGLLSSLLGKTPYLPFVADAASRQF